MDYIDRILYLIKTNKTSRKKVALSINADHVDFNRWMAREKELPLYLIPLIANHFDVPVDYILQGQEHPLVNEYPICNEGLIDCKFLHDGCRCVILTDTNFTRQCPFYKPQVRRYK